MCRGDDAHATQTHHLLDSLDQIKEKQGIRDWCSSCVLMESDRVREKEQQSASLISILAYE
jgi:hypothetical protein